MQHVLQLSGSLNRTGYAPGNIIYIYQLNNNNNNDRLTAFDPGQPG